MDEDDIEANASLQATLLSVGVIASLAACLVCGPLAGGLIGIAVAVAAIGVSRPASDDDYGPEATPPEACVIAASIDPATEIKWDREVTAERRWVESVQAQACEAGRTIIQR